MAAAPLSFGAEILEDLSCSICLDVFTRPKVLPCQHTFCQDCLQDHARNGRNFQCPNCRLQVRLPRQGIAGLPDNYLVTSLCEKLKRQATFSEETRSSEVAHCTTNQGVQGSTSTSRSTVQALITEGRNILESYSNFIRYLRDTEKVLNEEKQQTINSIIQAYNQMVQKLTERKDSLLSEAKQNHSENLGRIENVRDRVLEDMNELSLACDQAEQEMEMGGVKFFSLETLLIGVVGKYRGKALPTPVQIQSAVFQPTDTPVPVLGQYVMAQPLPAAPTPASPVPVHAAAFGTGDQEGNQEHDAFQLKDPLLGHVISKVHTVPSAPPPEESIFDDVEAWSTEHHHGKQGQEFHDQVFQLRDTSMPSSTHVAGQTLPPAPIPESSIASNTAAGSQGHHHSNQRQQKLLSQRMTFGGRGSKTGQFMSPTGVTVSNDFLISEIFVADRKNKRIQVFNLQGTFVRQFPTVMYPHDVAATDGEESEDIDLWVVGNTESADIAVQYNTQGRLLRKFALQDTGYTRGVAVDTRRNQILITSTTGDLFDKHGKVDVFKPDGTVVATVGCENGMKVPQYITVDCHSTGNIIVSDFEDNCVCVYSGDGQFLFKFGKRGRGEGLLKGPMGICTDWLGNIIVADSWNGRVELFDETGIFLHHITTDMQGPQAIAIAPEGQLVMTDSVNNTVTVFNNY